MSEPLSSEKKLVSEIEAIVDRVGFDWPSNEPRRDVPPERTLFHSRADLDNAVWHRAVLMKEIRRLREYEWMYKELQK
jgi:hypothetical protein